MMKRNKSKSQSKGLMTYATLINYTLEVPIMEFNQRELNYLLNCLNYHYENLDFKAPHIMELNAELCKRLDKQRRLQEIESN